MLIGKVAMKGFSWKQKNNAKSSIEMEFKSIDNWLSCVLWGLHFIYMQEYIFMKNAMCEE